MMRRVDAARCAWSGSGRGVRQGAGYGGRSARTIAKRM